MSWRPLADLEETWNPTYIEDYIQYAEQDIKDITQFIAKAKKKLETIKSIEWKPIVELNRSKSYATNRIEYYVSVRYRAADDPKKSYWPTDSRSKRFTGKERKLAFEYAEQLARELGVEIEMTGF